MGKIILQTGIYAIALCFLAACSKGGDNGDKMEGDDPSSDKHTYRIEIAGGQSYQGSVPKAAGGVYNPVSMVEFSEEINSKVLAGVLQEAGKFQIGIGLALDGDNKPSIEGTGPGFAFGEWGKEDKYGPVGPISMTLKNYKEHAISLFGEDGMVASYTLNFSGKFKLGASGAEVDVTGEIVVAGP